MSRGNHKRNRKVSANLLAFVSLALSWSLGSFRNIAAQEADRVTAIAQPSKPLPSEAESRGITKYSFLVYGDTRGRRDGIEIQYEHSLVIDSMLAQIKNLKNTEFPVRFVLQSGDAVVDGRDVQQWNVSFVPLMNRLTTEGGVPYFLVPGNHEGTTSPEGLRNYLDAVSTLLPPDGSPRRLSGTATYAFAYGNAFVIGLDANIPEDEKQYQWIKGQLEGLDRSRYTNVIVFCHQAPFSSGPHGGPNVESETKVFREKYMPLFHTHHVRAVFSGHEHLFEHWVEHYTDSTGTHRMDLVVSGGGGAPIYTYTGEPDLEGYLKANENVKASLQHVVKPGTQDSPTPYHYVIVRVDGNKLRLQVVGVDWGRAFAPYRSNELELEDSSSN
jgi:hypothetical protein